MGANAFSRLARYWQKREFKETSEPKGKIIKHSKNRFVIQEHWSSHHHFDFRLEMDGVLKSWAVPKGVPRKNGIKHLAIPTEDHPVGYINFEGKIPKGQYGAGKVTIWDKGTYENLREVAMAKAYKEGKIEIKLSGKKLKGNYALVRMESSPEKEKPWLLIRIGDIL